MWLELIELMLADQRRAAIIKKATNFVNVKANVTESARNRRCSQKDSDQRDRDCFLSNDVHVNFRTTSSLTSKIAFMGGRGKRADGLE